MKQVQKELELVKKGFKKHKSNISTKEMANIKAKEMVNIGYEAKVIKNAKTFSVWVLDIALVKTSKNSTIPTWSKALDGNRERLEFISKNKIPNPNNEKKNPKLDELISNWLSS